MGTLSVRRATTSGHRSSRLAGLKPWHWLTIAFHIIVILPLLWFALAYGGLPRLWSRHEHKKIGSRSQIQSYTAQDIPGDPINLRFRGSEAGIACAFKRAGWSVADPVSLWSGVKIGTSVLLQRSYPNAPVSPLFVQDQMQSIAFEKDEGKSADKRHHVRVWRIGDQDWLAAATFDRGVGLNLFTLQITHHIGPDVDREREAIGKLLMVNGAKFSGTTSSRIMPGQWHRNGGGDRYQTDGEIAVYVVPSMGC